MTRSCSSAPKEATLLPVSQSDAIKRRRCFLILTRAMKSCSDPFLHNFNPTLVLTEGHSVSVKNLHFTATKRKKWFYTLNTLLQSPVCGVYIHLLDFYDKKNRFLHDFFFFT